MDIVILVVGAIIAIWVIVWLLKRPKPPPAKTELNKSLHEAIDACNRFRRREEGADALLGAILDKHPIYGVKLNMTTLQISKCQRAYKEYLATELEKDVGKSSPKRYEM